MTARLRPGKRMELTERMTRKFIAVVVLSAACHSPAPHAKEDFTEVNYANNSQFAAGRMAAGKQMGEWRYYYEDGSLLAKGEFVLGKCAGPWTLYDRRGRIDSAQRRGFYCEDGVFGIRIPGFDWINWALLVEVHDAALSVFPLSWNGTGVYLEGQWVGPLP
jgi:hypothetical protein